MDDFQNWMNEMNAKKAKDEKAKENQEHTRKLLKKKQPKFSKALEEAVKKS